jgi:lipopolysaccharide exporter
MWGLPATNNSRCEVDKILGAERSLSQRVAKGGMWVFALRLLEKCLRIIRLIILARLLAPNDFGLFGIALLAMATLGTLSEMGFKTALVQKKDDIAQHLDTAWTVSIIRGIVLFILLFISAPYVALFFNNPDVTPLIQVIGVSLLLAGFTNIGVVYFQKELEFNRHFAYQLSATLADFIVVVVAAFILKNVWALVLGQLIGSLTGLIASYIVHPYRPHFRLELHKARELFGFGKWVLGSTILVFLLNQGDDAFVGKLLGATMLGFYQMAYRIANMPTTEITHVISQVTFPAYAKIQNNLPRLRESYLRVLQVVACLSFPIAGLIFILAPDFTRLFLGVKWMPMVPAMQVLALWGFINSIGATTGPFFSSTGKPAIPTKLQFLALILLGLMIYPFSIHCGIVGTSLAVLLSTLVPHLIAFVILRRTIKCGMFNFAKLITVPLINTVFLMLFVYLINSYWANVVVSRMVLSVILGVIFYLCLLYISDKFFTYRFFDNLKMTIDSLKRV